MASTSDLTMQVLQSVILGITNATKELNFFFIKYTGMRFTQQIEYLRKKMAPKTKMSVEEFLPLRFSLLKEEAKNDRLYPIAQKMLTATCKKLDRGDGLDINEYFCSIILYCGGTIEERLEIAFMAFDFNNDGFITREEMHKFFEFFLGGTLGLLKAGCQNPVEYAISPENAKRVMEQMVHFEKIFDISKIDHLVNAAFDVADINKDNLISFEEWKQWNSKGGFAEQWGTIGQLFA